MQSILQRSDNDLYHSLSAVCSILNISIKSTLTKNTRYLSMGLLLSVLSMPVMAQNSDTRQQYQFTTTPAWVKPIKPAPAAEKQQNYGLSFLLLDNQVNWTKSDSHAWSRIAYEVNTQQGVAQASEIKLVFNPEYQTLDIHKIAIIRDGNERDVAQRSNIRLIQQESELDNSILSGLVTALVILEDVRVGDIIDYAYSVKGFNPVFGDKKFASFGVNWSIPMGKNHIRILTDKDKPLSHKVFGDKTKIKTKKRKHAIEYLWQKNNIEELPVEDRIPAWYMTNAIVEFSEYQSWQEVNDWAVQLFALDTPLSAALTEKNDALFSSAQSKQDYVKKVIEFAQNDIRYLGLEIGINSHKPNHPNLVMERRYGDCKDKALLIASMLNQHGVEASTALVSSLITGAVEQRLPSPGAFNHAISVINIDNQEFWVDSTRVLQYGPLNQISGGEFQKALVISPETKGLVDVTENRIEPTLVRISEVAEITENHQSASLQFTMEYSGDLAEAVRAGISVTGEEVFATNLINYYGQQYSDISWVEKPIIKDLPTLNKTQIMGTINIPQFFLEEGKLKTLRLYGSFLDAYVALPEVTERQSPLAIAKSMSVEHSIKVSFPRETNWNLPDGNILITNDNIKYSRELLTSANSVEAIHRYHSFDDHITIGEIPGYFRDIRQIKNALYLTIQMSGMLTEKQNELKDKMRSLLNL